MHTYLLSVSLLRVRSITPAPRLNEATMAALVDRWVERTGDGVWPPERCVAQPEARRPDAVAAQR